MVEVPIEIYDELVKSKVLLDVIRNIVMDSSKYATCGDIKKILEVISDGNTIRD